MKTPSLWQKLTSSFKKPLQKSKKKTVTGLKQTENFIPEFTRGGSVFHSKKGANRIRKHKKRLENKARAIQYCNC